MALPPWLSTFGWKHQDLSEQDTTVPLCISLSHQRMQPQGSRQMQRYRRKMLSVIYVRFAPRHPSEPGVLCSKAQETFLLLAETCPRAEKQRAKPAPPAPQPDAQPTNVPSSSPTSTLLCPIAWLSSRPPLPCCTLNASSCFLPAMPLWLQFGSPKTDLCPCAPVSATCAGEVCAQYPTSPLLQLSGEATRLPGEGLKEDLD